jgi:ribosomal protein S18 acetylase RimI-like enzyme
MFAPYEPRETGRPRRPTGDGPLVRAATPDDAGAIAALLAEREGGNLEGRLEKNTAELGRPEIGGKRMLLVGEVGGQVVGFARVVYLVPAADAPANVIPEGWYLGGVVVTPAYRRRGIGHALTRHRLEWLRDHGVSTAWFFVNAENRASIDLHAPFGFREVTRDFVGAGVSFSGRGEGILYRVELDAAPAAFSG